MIRIGLTHKNENFLYTVAIAKQLGKRVELSDVPCVDKQELILSTLRNQQYARQMSSLTNGTPWLYYVFEVPGTNDKPLA